MTHWHKPKRSELRNWNNLCRFRPTLVATPENIEDLSAAIVEAINANFQITLHGSGHSFRSIAGENLLILPSGGISIDEQLQTVTALGGTPIRQIVKALHLKGLAMENLGDVMDQTIAGAIASATHGTGADFCSIASQAVSAIIVDGLGNQLETSLHSNPDLFRAALVPGGVFTVIAQVTLRVRSAFKLLETKQKEPLESALSQLPEIAIRGRYTFMCWPQSDVALIRIWQETSSQRDSWLKRKWHKVTDQYVKENFSLGFIASTVRRFPCVAPGLVKMVAKLAGGSPRIDDSFNILTHPRLIKYNEAEYQLPFDNAVPALQALINYTKTNRLHIIWPLFMRVVRADELPMSPFSKSHAGSELFASISILHSIGMKDEDKYLEDTQQILRSFGGRPHWGKANNLSKSDVEHLYSSLPEFKRQQAEYDPNHLFTSEYYSQLFF